MKTASLRCGAVIALLFLAAKAEAQIDSNAEVHLFNSNVCRSCEMSIDGFQTYAGCCITYDTSQSLEQWSPNPYPFSGLTFTLDTMNKEFQNVTIYSGQGIQFPDGIQGSGTAQVTLKFDSVPYIVSSGHIIAEGPFQCICYFHAIAATGGLRQQATCDDSTNIIDTIEIDINLISSIVQSYTAIKEALQVRSNIVGMLIAFFQTSENSQELYILDALSRTIASIQVPAGAESIELPIVPLPPSLYFARLRNQVAKFVVPPR